MALKQLKNNLQMPCQKLKPKYVQQHNHRKSEMVLTNK